MGSILSMFRRPPRPVAGVVADSSGATVVIIAIAISAIVGFAGLGTEVAGWYMTQRSMQAAVDAAASAGAASLASAEVSAGTTQCPSSSNYCQDDANSVAANYGYVNGTASTTVTINNPPATTTGLTACTSPFSSYNCYVEVIISQPQTALLSAVFLSSGPTISARSVATANTQVTDQGCVLALDRASADPYGMNNTGTTSMNFSGCALYVNNPNSGALSLSGTSTSISALAAYVSGGISGSGLTTTDGTYTGTNPTSDPYADVPAPSFSGCSDSNGIKLDGTGGNKSSLTIPPPSFSGSTYVICKGINLTSANVVLTVRPGFTYVLDNGTFNVVGNATVTQCTGGSPGCAAGPNSGGGVTFFLTADGNNAPANVSWGSNSVISLTAPTSGTYSGLALFQNRVTCTTNNNGNGSTNNGNGSCANTLAGGASQNITGAIYFPKNSVNYTGGSSSGGSQCTQLIANQITFSGNSQFNSSCQSAGTKTIGLTNGTLVM